MGCHRNKANILLGCMLQNLFRIVSVSHVSIHLETFGFELFLNPAKVIFGFPDDFDLRIRGIHTREGMGVDNPQQSDTGFQIRGQFLDERKSDFRAG
jgi:hypothetical protein